jgi:hypothetical protein
MISHDWPDIGPEHDQRQSAIRQILLICDVLIGSNHHIERGSLGGSQEFTIFQLGMPAHAHKRLNFVLL